MTCKRRQLIILNTTRRLALHRAGGLAAAAVAAAARRTRRHEAAARMAGRTDDDDVCDANFHQFYKVSMAQRVFNEMIASEYQSGERDRCWTKVELGELIGSGCDRNLIGLGPVHVFAPHLHLGLPLPPCPKCGWDSVDNGKLRTRVASAQRGAYMPIPWMSGWLVSRSPAKHARKRSMQPRHAAEAHICTFVVTLEGRKL